ncbi:PAS domain S-box-containing protein [Pelomonas saccharophila]|uniref:histidine kinase n=1 Tax=Roseateles saccharophilus TaxID=304 RepID=A0ABU1YRJ0_ROSSA|nr:response regulator [Roseateles saccharophilus]MDR7271474.1 PAS domain S-box-containing protein [Roseateles saccharophilus]
MSGPLLPDAPVVADPRKLDRSRHRVLVVNDDPVGRYATVRQLQAAGFPVVEAASGMEALALADESLSAVVLDIHLPDIDGLEVCRRLRRQPTTFKLPVIHLTAAYLTDEDKVRGLDSGADAYLTHPVEPAVIVSTIQALVRTREAEDAMRHSEAKFRAAFEGAPSGIGLLDTLDGRLLDVNPAMLALLGRTQAEVTGRVLQDFVAAADAGAAAAFVSGLSTESAHAEFQLAQPDGRLVPIEWAAATYTEPGIAMLVATDISQRLLLAQQRQELLDRERSARGTAERHSRLKDDLIAVLSHELRTPLNVILNWAHMLQKRSQPEMLERGLAAIERNAVIQARLISDILDMSRLNLGKLPLNLDWVDAGSIVAASVTAVQPLLQRSNHHLRLDLQQEDFKIYADDARIQQVLWNLLGNAVKFSPAGSEITLTLRVEEGGVALTVADQGEGIAADFLPFVFDRFAQSDASSNRRHGGLGLGLAIVKNLVEAHGGHVSVASAGRAQGAQFAIWLPGEHSTTSPADLGAASAFGAQGAPSTPLVGLKVLLVEDDLEAGAMLSMILGEQGVQVQHEASVDAALQSLAVNRFDLLISDIGMPDRDGYELIRELRQREGGGARLPAIALTAFSRQTDRDSTLAAGFDVHLGKPVRPQQLLTQILRVTGMR